MKFERRIRNQLLPDTHRENGSALHQEVALVSLSVAEAQAIVAEAVGGRRFKMVAGEGQFNVKPKVKWRAPTISVDVEPRQDAPGSRVDIWLGAHRVQAGLIQQPNYLPLK